MIHAGIDLHFTNMVNAKINDSGEEIWSGKIPATRESTCPTAFQLIYKLIN